MEEESSSGFAEDCKSGRCEVKEGSKDIGYEVKVLLGPPFGRRWKRRRCEVKEGSKDIVKV